MRKAAIVKAVVATVIFVGGASVFLYPTISNLLNERSQTALIENFDETAKNLTQGDKEKAAEAAQAYNEALAQHQGTIVDPFGDQATSPDGASEETTETVSFLKLGELLGYVQIPTIDLKAPVYDNVREATLQKGIGLLPGTSLPVGGPSTNTVLSGHRGLPTAKLFTDINKLEIGDEFFFKNSVEVLAFEVVEKEIIDPNEFEALAVVKGRERMTLLTCHPYMINSHRLLVIGERVPYEGQLDAIEDNKGFFDSLRNSEKELLLEVLILGALLALTGFFIVRSRRRKKAKGALDE